MKLRRRTWGLLALVVCLAAGLFWWAMVSARPTLTFERFEDAADGRRLAVFTFENPTWFELYWATYMSRGPLLVQEAGKLDEPVDVTRFTELSPDPVSDSIAPGLRLEMRLSLAGSEGRPFRMGVEYYPPGLRLVGLWNWVCSAAGSDYYVDPESRVIWSETVMP